MDFRLVLQALAAAGLASPSAIAEFDAAFASRETLEFVLFARPSEVTNSSSAVPTVKAMSGYLDRLFKMGFLRRRSVARVVTTRSGKKCNRGFKYVYSFSRQGLRYLEHMTNPKQARALYGQTPADIYSTERLREILPDNLKHDAARINFAMFRGFNGGGRYRRFPLKEHPILAMLVSRYEKELRQKDEEILRLRAQLESTRRFYQT